MAHYDPDHTRRHYDDLGPGEAERWQRSRFMQMQREVFEWHLAQRVSPGQRVLEAGCGAGVYTRQLLELGATVAYLEGSIVDLSEFDDVVLALGGARANHISAIVGESPPRILRR